MLNTDEDMPPSWDGAGTLPGRPLTASWCQKYWGSGCHILASLASKSLLAEVSRLSTVPRSQCPAHTVQGCATLHNLWIFVRKKKNAPEYNLFSHFLSPSHLQEIGDVRQLQLPCWSQRGQTYWVSPMSAWYCSTSFSEPSNPLSSGLSLETAGRNKCKCLCKQTQIRLKCNCSTAMTCLSPFQCL